MRGGHRIRLSEADDRHTLSCIKEWMAVNGYPPTVRQLAQCLGITSTSSIKGRLDRLVQQGMIERIPGSPRAIRILDAD